MYCICCKEDTVLPYDIKYPDSGISNEHFLWFDNDAKLTEVDLLWEKTNLYEDSEGRLQ